ncbi:sigma-70 family RNA polymerase sigma factor [Geodermatophilus sp. URMC 63]
MDTTLSDHFAVHRARCEMEKPRSRRTDADLQQAAATFMVHRPQLLRIAGGILASASEAEDVVQETWLRWQRTDRRVVSNPPGFLTTAASRLAINVLQSARTRHETALGPELEGERYALAVTDTAAELTESAELAISVLLQRLSPAERGAFVLRRGFDYSYPEVARALRLSAQNARKLVSRADARIRTGDSRPVEFAAHRRLVRAFVRAARAGEFTDLEALLAEDIR